MKKLLFTLTLAFFAFGLCAEFKAPEFMLENLDGTKVKLSDFLQKGPVIVDFWASWCTPCKEELPTLSQLAEKYPHVTVLAITIDKAKDLQKAKNIVKSKNYSFVTLTDPTKEVSDKFGVTTIPRTFIINTDGKIVFDHSGYKAGDEKSLEAELNKYLKKENK